MFVNTDVSYKISFSFSLLYCHKDMQNKKFYIIKPKARKPNGNHRGYKEWAFSVNYCKKNTLYEQDYTC